MQTYPCTGHKPIPRRLNVAEYDAALEGLLRWHESTSTMLDAEARLRALGPTPADATNDQKTTWAYEIGELRRRAAIEGTIGTIVAQFLDAELQSGTLQPPYASRVHQLIEGFLLSTAVLDLRQQASYSDLGKREWQIRLNRALGDELTRALVRMDNPSGRRTRR